MARKPRKTEPPSQKQIDYIKALGVSAENIETSADASRIIEAVLPIRIYILEVCRNEWRIDATHGKLRLDHVTRDIHAQEDLRHKIIFLTKDREELTWKSADAEREYNMQHDIYEQKHISEHAPPLKKDWIYSEVRRVILLYHPHLQSKTVSAISPILLILIVAIVLLVHALLRRFHII